MTERYYEPPRTFYQAPVNRKSRVARLWNIFTDEASHYTGLWRINTEHGRPQRRGRVGRVLQLAPLLFIGLWIYTLWWGERLIFRRQVQDCTWEHWESWVGDILHRPRGCATADNT